MWIGVSFPVREEKSMIENLVIALAPAWWWFKRNKWYFIVAGAAIVLLIVT